MRILFTLLLAAAMLTFAGLALGEGDALYVSVSDGNDANSGAIDSPLQSIDEALLRLRWNPTSERATVWLREGTYALDEVLVMTAYDRGNVTFASYPGETATIIGSRPVTGFTETLFNGRLVWCAPYESMSAVNALYGDDGARSLSRWPKQGYFRVAKPAMQTSDKFQKQQRFYANPGDAPTMMQGVMVRLLHWWKDEITTVSAYDPLTGLLELGRPTSMAIFVGDRYFFENVLTISMDPGEWAYDADEGLIYYAPREGEQIETTKLYAGFLEQLIYINGVSGVAFENITFAQTAWNIPRGDLASDFPQAAYDANAAVVVLNAEDTQFVGCTFRDMGSGCIQFGGVNKGARVVDCAFEDIGAHAVYIHGENTQIASSITEGFVIENNHIQSYGKNFYNAAAVLIIHARNVSVMHNEIHDGTYTAVSAGWVWGKGYSVTGEIRIENNLLYNIGKGVLSDMGAIYLLGAQPGTVVSGNVIHDVISAEYGGWGIYLDEGAAEIRVTHNLVYRCSAQGFHQHDGVGNTVSNNIFALSYDGQIGLSTAGSFTLDANVIVGTQPFLRNEGGTIRQGKNLMTSDSSIFVDAAADTFAIRQTNGLSEIGFIPWVFNAGLYAGE